jgi:hypothetical protein
MHIILCLTCWRVVVHWNVIQVLPWSDGEAVAVSMLLKVDDVTLINLVNVVQF